VGAYLRTTLPLMGKRPVPKDQRAKHVADCLAHMGGGGTIREYAREHSLNYSTVVLWMREDVPADQYARAREAQADALFEELEELSRSAIGIPADQVQGYRLAVDTLKWKAARLAPRYSDKQQVEHSGAIGSYIAEVPAKELDAATWAKGARR
jgi:hypothetical protein